MIKVARLGVTAGLTFLMLVTALLITQWEPTAAGKAPVLVAGTSWNLLGRAKGKVKNVGKFKDAAATAIVHFGPLSSPVVLSDNEFKMTSSTTASTFAVTGTFNQDQKGKIAFTPDTADLEDAFSTVVTDVAAQEGISVSGSSATITKQKQKASSKEKKGSRELKLSFKAKAAITGSVEGVSETSAADISFKGVGGVGNFSSTPGTALVVVKSVEPNMQVKAFSGEQVRFSVEAESSEPRLPSISTAWSIDRSPASDDSFFIDVDTDRLPVGEHSIAVELRSESAVQPLTLVWRLTVVDVEGEDPAAALVALNAPPSLESLSPFSEVTVGPDTTLGLMAVGADPNTSDTLEYEWLVDEHAVAATGSRLEIPTAAYRPGLYLVTLRAFDRNNLDIRQVAPSATNDDIQEVLDEAGDGDEISPAAAHDWVVRILDSAQPNQTASGSIRKVSPLSGLRILVNSPLLLDASVVSDGGSSPIIKWSIDGIDVPKANSETFLYEPQSGDEGAHAITVEVAGTDDTAEQTEKTPMSFTWLVEVLDERGVDVDESSLGPRPSALATVVDNTRSENRLKGKWKRSQGFGAYGPNSVYAKGNATFTFEASLPRSQEYDVYLWWSQFALRSTATPVTIDHERGADTLTVNQLRDTGRWNYLGTYLFGESATVSLAADPPMSTCADAVCFSPVETRAPGTGGAALVLANMVEDGTVTIIDNGDSGTVRKGTWKSSRGREPYGGTSLYARKSGSYAFNSSLTTGTYRVYLWWTSYWNRSTRVPVEIATKQGTSRVEINQRRNGGQWNLVGTFEFDDSAQVKLLVDSRSSVCADAVKFEWIEVTDDAPPDPSPDAPAGLVITEKEDSTLLDWQDNAEPDFDFYKVYRSTTPGADQLLAYRTHSNYLDSAAEPETTYYYRVTAVDTAGHESAFSTEVSGTPIDLAPLPPLGVTAIGEPDSIRLDWSDNREHDLNGYRVYRRLGSQTNYTMIDNVGSSSHVDNDVVANTTYFYAIAAVDDAGNESDLSVEVSGATNAPPAAPRGLSAVEQVGAIALNWNNNSESDLSGYKVYRRTGGQFQRITTVAQSEYRDTGVQVQVNYTYAITAVDKSGSESPFSAEVTATPVNPPPVAPVGLVAQHEGGRVSLDWKNNSETDLDRYIVYRATKPGGAYQSVGNATNSNFADTSVDADVTYYYVVTALDAAGGESQRSTEAVAAPNSQPPATGELAIGWEAPITNDDGSPIGDLLGYRVHYGTSSGNYSSVIDVGNVLEYTIGSLPAGTYYVTVTAYDASGNESGFPGEVSDQIP